MQANGINIAKYKKLNIAIDLTPLLPGGANGGIKQYIYECVYWLRKHFGSKIKYTFLSSAIIHDEISKKLADEFDSVVCININGEFNPSKFYGGGAKNFLWYPPPSDILWKLGVDVLYCPFGSTSHHCPGIPTIATVVDLLHLDYPASISNQEREHREGYFKKMAQDADAFQCISDYGMNRLSSEYNIPYERIFRTHLIIADRLKKDKKKVEESQLKTFFYPANFWEHKNHKTLLVAFAKYVSRMGSKSWNLILTGHESSESKKILELANVLGVQNYVCFKGHVSEEELHDIWSNASALVFPSLHEGFGIPLVEAMAYNLPIICGVSTCLKEVAGDAALFVDPSNPAEIAEALVTLSQDRVKRELLSRNSSLRFNEFSFDREMLKLASTIERLAEIGSLRSTLKGISAGKVDKVLLFNHSHKGEIRIIAKFLNEGEDARAWMSCGNRKFGSWKISTGKETTIDSNIYCDGAPCNFEFILDSEKGAKTNIRCISLKIVGKGAENIEQLI